MPIVDLAAPSLDVAVDTPKGFAVTPGQSDVDQGSDAPDFGTVLGAGFRQDNTIVSWATSETRGVDNTPDGTNAWDAIKGTKYEPLWENFVSARNGGMVEAKKRQIDNEEESRRILSAAPWYQSFPAQMVAGALDWPTLLPGGAFVRGIKGGFSVGKSALNVGVAAGASMAVQEAALQGIQETRPASETAINIGASVLLGGLLGAGGAKLLSRAEWSSAVKAIDSELAGVAVKTADAELGARLADNALAGSPQSAGAAAVVPSSIADNTIAGKAAGALAASTAKINPALRLLQSPSAAVREIAPQLFENSLYLKKNYAGVASEPAVETLMKEWNAGLAKAVRATNEAYGAYWKSGGGTKLGQYTPGRRAQLGLMSEKEFHNAVGAAMRRGDTSDIPEVAAVAKAWRTEVFDPLKEAAISAKLLPEDVTVDTATSYFSRMWNRNKLIAKEGEFKQIVSDYYAKSMEKEFATSAEAHSRRTARIEQEISDLQLTGENRVVEGLNVEGALSNLEARTDLMEKVDRLNDLRQNVSDAVKAGDKKTAADIRKQIKAMELENDGELKKFLEERSSLRARRRSIEYGIAGMEERSQKLLEKLADVEDANFRAMERLVKKGQKLERDLDRLDADAIEDRVSQLAESYSKIARQAEASAERADRTIENIRKAAERGTERNTLEAQRAATEAKLGPPEEAAGKLAAAKEAADKNIKKRADADAAISLKLGKEAERQRALAKRMDDLSERLRAAREFDHDGLMEEIRSGITKAMRETSAGTMARGERAAKIGERLQAADPARVVDRVKSLEKMRLEADAKFIERWEAERGAFDVDPKAKAAKFNEVSREISNEVFDALTGRVESGIRPEFITIQSRGPMKERTFHIPDELVEEFLESDVDLVGRRYARIMGADVELAGKFGSVDLKDQVAKIRADYDKLRAGVKGEKELSKLATRESADIRDLEALRDLLRGTRNESPIERSYGRLARVANHLNYIRSMGEVVLASLPDAIRPAMVHGMRQYLADMSQLTTNLRGIKLSVKEAQLAGNVAETVLGHRMATISEIIDPYAVRGPIESFLENMTNFGSKWNGIRIWTDAMKSIASVMTQNRVLLNVADFTKIKASEKAYLAYLGIDESMAGRIAARFAKHGETIDGVRVANTDEWTKGLTGTALDHARVEVRIYRAAINKDVDSIIVQRSVADVPLFASTPTGRMLLQFKSFALASHQKVLLRGLQEDQSRFLSGMIAMTTMGMFITWAKSVSGNRTERLQEITDNPGWWAMEGLDRTGVLSIPMEFANAFEKVSGINPIKTPFKAFDKNSALSQKMQNRNELGSLLGPSFGLVSDMITVGGIPKAVASGEDIKKGQKSAAERLLPFNSYLGIRQMMRYIVNDQN